MEHLGLLIGFYFLLFVKPDFLRFEDLSLDFAFFGTHLGTRAQRVSFAQLLDALVDLSD